MTWHSPNQHDNGQTQVAHAAVLNWPPRDRWQISGCH